MACSDVGVEGAWLEAMWVWRVHGLRVCARGVEACEDEVWRGVAWRVSVWRTHVCTAARQVSTLLAALGDPSGDVRAEAAGSLSRLGLHGVLQSVAGSRALRMQAAIASGTPLSPASPASTTRSLSQPAPPYVRPLFWGWGPLTCRCTAHPHDGGAGLAGLEGCSCLSPPAVSTTLVCAFVHCVLRHVLL